MKNLKYIQLILCFMGIIVFNLPPSVYSEQTQNGTGTSDIAGSIIVKSNTFEIDNNKKTVTFSGDIDAKRDDFTINCQKMILFYLNEAGEKGSNEVSTRIGKIFASGKVRITRSDGSVASSEEAVYYRDDEKLVLTGGPLIRRGDDFVEGTIITLYLKENRSVVEGSEGIKARAILVPSSD